jgi:transcriptional regulator with XRE-family HTH domain
MTSRPISKNSSRIQKIQAYLNEHGFSQEQFARLAEISPSYISCFLSGKRTFGSKVALRISKLTGIPMEELYR